MKQYLLSTYAIDSNVPGAPKTPDEMNNFMERVMLLEEKMYAAGVFVFGGALMNPPEGAILGLDNSKVQHGQASVADSKEQLAGFYIINAVDDEDAFEWASRVVAATNHPIEVRSFRATGRLKDQMPR